MPRERPLAYDIKKFPGPTSLRVEAWFECAGCGKTAVLNIGEVHNPEKLANRLKKHGWRGSAWCPRRDIMCPECLRKGSEKNADPLSELRRFVEKKARHAAELVVSTPELAALANTPMSVTKEGITFPQQQENTTMAPRPKLPGDTPPSSDARVAIRAALDKHFDDKSGIYLDGQSDEKIAADLDYPRKWVSDIREAAYGPIRERPEITQLKAEIEALRLDMATDAQSFADKQEKHGKRLAELIEKADMIGRRVS